MACEIDWNLARTRFGEAAGRSMLVVITAVLVSLLAPAIAFAAPGDTAERANSYDDEWQDGPDGWAEKAKSILAANSGQNEGMLIHIGDSLTRSPYIGNWAISGRGRTAQDSAICAWMHAGENPQSIATLDGFYLQAPNKASSLGYPGGYARSYTVGDGRGAWDFMGTGGMPDITDPATAIETLEDFAAYPNDLSLTTILSGIQRPQFATIQVNLVFSDPGKLSPDLVAMYDLLESYGIVPIVVTHPYRRTFDPPGGTTSLEFNTAVDQYNAAVVALARERKYPLVDWNQEMLYRIPLASIDETGVAAWQGRFLSGDGVHLTGGNETYDSFSDPYANGGDPNTHTTGAALTYSGYSLRGWLLVQKMKEIRRLVFESQVRPMPPENLHILN